MNSSMNSSPPTKERMETQNELPIVFQCENCKTIVGDTLSSISANNTLRMITLGCVTNKVHVREKLVSSSHSADIGSSYNPLSCETCNTDLGRIYRTTTFQLDELRDKYSLYVDRLSCYRVGSEEQPSEMSSFASVPSNKQLDLQIRKLQAVSVSLNGRIIEIEERLKEDSSRYDCVKTT